mmetsp:Transcript_32413/g.74047  ORF Transcript_32413/g.74047 Transcript_32413/m.74047 type:complete len:412 (+) Transcript_32413:2-1237(+)
MHAMTQEVVRDLLMGGFKRQGLSSMLTSLFHAFTPFTTDDAKTFSVGRDYAAHVKASVSHVDWSVGDTPDWALQVAGLCGLTANYYYFVVCGFESALALHNVEMDLKGAVLGGEHSALAGTHKNIGNVKMAQGKLEAALECYAVSLDIGARPEGELRVADGKDKDMQAAGTYNNMALIYRTQEKYDDALKMFDKCLQIRIAKKGEQSIEVAKLLHNMGALFQWQKLFDRSLEHYTRAQNIFISQLGKDHIFVAKTCITIGSIFSEQREYLNARTELGKAIKILLATVEPGHMDLAAAYDYMGTAYAESRCDAPPAAGRGDLPKALEWYEKSLDVVKAAVGEKHPQAADTMFNIAQVRRAQGELDVAAKLYHDCEAIYLAAYGAEHSETLATAAKAEACEREAAEMVANAGP